MWKPQEMYGLGRSLGGENGNPLQYSCVGNPMDRGGGYCLWVAKSDATEHACTVLAIGLRATLRGVLTLQPEHHL